MLIFRTLAVTAAAMSLTACATVTRGTNTAWEVQTDPSGAKVETSHGHQCQATPCSMKMARKSQFTATITKPGYKPATVSVTNKVSGAGGVGMAGNVLVGGIIGVGVDAASGAMLDLTPNPAILKLEPELAATTVATSEPAAAVGTPPAAPAATPAEKVDVPAASAPATSTLH